MLAPEAAPPTSKPNKRKMTEPKHYRQAFKDLEKAENLAEEVNRLALLLGTRPDGLNTANAQRAVSKAVEELVEARQQAEDNGYRSLAVALKALGQKTPDLQLPEWARFAPAHWTKEASVETIYYWKNGRRVDAPERKAAVTPVQAQRQLDRLKPTLKTVLDELEDRPDQQENVKEALMTLSYDVFQERVFSFLRGEHVDEEGEEETTAEQPDLELEAKVEELRAESEKLGLEFDEEVARALLVNG